MCVISRHQNQFVRGCGLRGTINKHDLPITNLSIPNLPTSKGRVPISQNVLQNSQQPGPAQSFFHKGIAAGLQTTLFGKLIAMDGEQHNQGWARQSFQLTGHVKTVSVGQFDIEDDQVGIQLERQAHCLRSVCGISYHSETRLIDEQPAQTFPHGWGIVYDQDAIRLLCEWGQMVQISSMKKGPTGWKTCRSPYYGWTVPVCSAPTTTCAGDEAGSPSVQVRKSVLPCAAALKGPVAVRSGF